MSDLDSRPVRYSKLLIPTLKQVPADAEVVSHKLMVRAGMIRQIARGIYDLLPLGLRVVKKVENIVREEMDRAGAQEILMPAICPAELWNESGRWEQYGRELLRVKDRHDRDFCFGPTHEEVVTDIVRRDVRSYRELPINLYQIQSKFRDELRPRFGLMRGREFIMKDAYSFHMDAEDCQREYQLMADTYDRIFRRCGLDTRQVESDTGAIGGRRAHEFHVLAESGEDAIVSCNHCDYAANVEKAEIREPVDRASSEGAAAVEKIHTPGKGAVDEVAELLGEATDHFIKTLIYRQDDGKLLAVVVRGDFEISDAKLRSFLGVEELKMAEADEVQKATGAEIGFAGPIDLDLRIIADFSVRGVSNGICGANETDYHLKNVVQSRDFPKVEFADLRTALKGDPCPRCDQGSFNKHRGIEVGNIFYLGNKYSSAMKATCLDTEGKEVPLEMGCYGIGITRTAAAAIEQYNDDQGILWPLALAPAHVHLIPLRMADEKLCSTAETLYQELQDAGVEVLLDDRDERPGAKFKDADLIGIPLRIALGPKSLERGCVEFKRRSESEVKEVPVSEIVAFVKDIVQRELAS